MNPKPQFCRLSGGDHQRWLHPPGAGWVKVIIGMTVEGFTVAVAVAVGLAVAVAAKVLLLAS